MDLCTLADNLRGISLNARFPDGRITPIGHRDPVVDWRLRHPRLLRRILRRPFPRLERSYLRGDWELDTRHLPALILAFARACPRRPWSSRLPLGDQAARQLQARWDRASPDWHDSDLWLARACLGEELLQGCAHYREPGIGQEQAQRLRCRDLCAQLRLTPEQQLLDLSAGWGALALFLAQHTGVRVTGLVAGERQLRHARQEAQRRGLSAIVTFHLRTGYRRPDRFDRIVANDIVDPANPAHRLLPKITALLHANGLAWLQFRARRLPVDVALPPRCAAALPTLARLHRALENSPLRALQLQDLSADRWQDLHSYARRLRRQRETVARYFGEPRVRAWEWHLASEMVLLEQGQLSQYEIILGNTGCRWQAGHSGHHPGVTLPLAIAEKIPGLAQNL